MSFANKPGTAASSIGLDLPKISEQDTVLAYQDRPAKDPDYTNEPQFDALLLKLKDDQQRAELIRRSDEVRWVKAHRNYRGLYGSEIQFTETEKSRVFIKITKTKVIAAYGQLIDVLFSGNRFPIGIEPSKLPEGIPDAVHIDPKEQDEEQQDTSPDADDPSRTGHTVDFGYSGDGRDLPPGATITDLIGSTLAKELEELDVKPGPGVTPSSITYEPAMLAAKKMEKKIIDQLNESNADKHLRYAAFEMALFGTGILKGPFAVSNEAPRWDEKGTYDPLISTAPRMEATSLWDLYVDPDARNPEELQYVIQRHRLNDTQLRKLKKRPYFRANAIDALIATGYNYTRKWWETEIRDSGTSPTTIKRYEVFEFWGIVDKETLENTDLKIPKALADFEELQVNVWYSGDNILRLVLNPFVPARIPYHICPYEMNIHSCFGIGIAENMEDTQTLMNGFMRMAVDNAVLSGNLVFEVDETMLVPGQDMKIYPGKVFRRLGGAPGQSIFGTKYPNVTQENMLVFDKARQLADEATGLPSFSHGQPGVTGTGRTASSLSMLMGAASTNIKSVIKNCDDYLLRPLGEAFFHFNMQFDYDESIKGDLEVKAKGTESLMQNEVMTQRLTTFLQVGSNPIMAPHMKFPYILREIAKRMELDPDKVCNNPDEAMRQAMLMQAHGSMPMQGGDGQATPPGQPGQPGPTPAQAPGQPPAPGAPPGAQPASPNGGGNIGAGTPPTPGTQGFTG